MKKLNSKELENIYGDWFWQKLPFPEAEYSKMNIGYIHRKFGGDFCITEDKFGSLRQISLEDANSLVIYCNMGIIKPANCK